MLHALFLVYIISFAYYYPESGDMMASQQDSLGFLLANVSRLLRRAFQQQLEGSSLTLAQARALIYVSRHEGVRQVELADLLEVQPITLARLVDQLAAAGLVERRPDPTDRRAYLVFLTPDAAPHLLAIRQVTAAIQADALRGLSDKQTTTLLLALRTMRDNLSTR
jgi:DNA-binding MarR family transcriptional regulator